MNDFDKYLRSKAAEEQREIPDSVKINIEQTLTDLDEINSEKKHFRVLPQIAAAAACFIFITLVLLPNLSIVYAQALENVPIIGDIIRVVTFRNYTYSDGHHEMDIDVPKIKDTNNEAADYINMDVNELANTLVNQFYRDLEINGSSSYGSLHVDYETVTNTERWFTLKFSVSETAASSNNYFKYYHIDKLTGKIVKLSDLFSVDNFTDVLSEEIKKQMQQQMKADKEVKYWIHDSEIGENFSSVSEDQNFYWNENGELVIVFDKYEVGPGFMGTPEFVISKEIVKDILKPEFIDNSGYGNANYGNRYLPRASKII